MLTKCMKSRAQCTEKLSIFKSEVDKGVSLKPRIFKLLAMKTCSLKRSKWQNVTNFLEKKKYLFFKSSKDNKGSVGVYRAASGNVHLNKGDCQQYELVLSWKHWSK